MLRAVEADRIARIGKARRFSPLAEGFAFAKAGNEARIACSQHRTPVSLGVNWIHGGGVMHPRAAALRSIAHGLAVVALISTPSRAQREAPKPAIPVDPIPAILDAFRLHAVVAPGDAHGNAQAQAFLKSLVRDPRFAATVNDIVIEFGNALYQRLVDRFVNGADVPRDSLRQVWR